MKSFARISRPGLLVLMSLFVGCSSVDKISDASHPTSFKHITNALTPAERSEAGLTQIAISPASYAVTFDGVNTKGKWRAALTGSLDGASQGCELFADDDSGAVLIVTALFSVVGAISGAVITESKDEIEAQLCAARLAAQSCNPQEYLLRQISDLIRESPAHARVRWKLRKPVADEGNKMPATAPTYDSTLTITILSIGTQSANYAPSLFSRDVVDILVETRVLLTRNDNGKVLHEGRYSARSKASKAREFKEWTDHDARRFHKEILLALNRIAECIVHDTLYPTGTQR